MLENEVEHEGRETKFAAPFPFAAVNQSAFKIVEPSFPLASLPLFFLFLREETASQDQGAH